MSFQLEVMAQTRVSGLCVLSVGSDRVERMFDKEDIEPIPPGLENLEPGPVLACLLAAINVDQVSGYNRIVVLRAHNRMASHYAAQSYRAMTSVSDYMNSDFDDDPLLANEAAAAEIRAGLRLTRSSADHELGFALDLNQRLPRVWEALAAGLIDVRRARVINNATFHLPIGTARNVADEIIGRAGDLTAGQLASRLRRLCIEVDPDQAKRRYEQAVTERRVVAEPTVAGTTNLFAIDLPPHRAAAASRRINHLARQLRTPGETRTMDQLRADVLLGLLAGTGPAVAGQKGVVDIHAELTSLTRLTNDPGYLAGYGPVIADIARQVTEDQQDGQWRYTITDGGRLVSNGITRRRPTKSERRYVEARDPICVFPGCRMPATSCDIDHRITWGEGGPTHQTNLAPLCRHDHNTIKHKAGWTYDQLSEAEFGEDKLEPRPWRGDYQFTSHLGHTYTTSGRSP